MIYRISVFAALLTAYAALAGDWPSWRGPKGDGVVADPNVPVSWSATENVVWKVPVPGIGHSSPVISAGRVFLTSFLRDTNDRVLLCFNRADGRLLWQKVILTAPPEPMHAGSTPANATPVADGQHVWVTFTDGKAVVVACRDFAGQAVWEKSFPGFVSPHGFCGTPTLFEDAVIVNGDSDGDAFVAALDKMTGKVLWTADRPNRTRSFSVPLVISVKDQPQLVLAGSKSVTGFDPRTGKAAWIVESETAKFVATPAYADGVVVATGTSPTHTITGIAPAGVGNVSKSHVLWTHTRGGAYVPSPLAVGKRVFVLTDEGIATLIEARSGKSLWVERLGGRLFRASPLLVNGLVYCLAENGTTYVVRPDDEFALVARNKLDQPCYATPAVSEGKLFLRTSTHLWCVGRKHEHNRCQFFFRSNRRITGVSSFPIK